MEESSISLSILPSELISHIMFHMSLEELYSFSFACRMTYKLAENESLWKNAYRQSLPQIYSALSQQPYPEYWQYSVPGSRQFGYLVLIEKKNQSRKSPHVRPKTLSRAPNPLKQQVVSSGFKENQGPPPIINGEGYQATPPPETKLVMDVMCRTLMHVQQQQQQQTYHIRQDYMQLMITGCYLLRRLTYTPADCSEEYQNEMSLNRNILGENQVVEVLLKILEDSYEEPALVAAAICAINNVACDDNCERIVKGMGIQLILQSMKKYPSIVSVIDYGASALANIMREIQDEDLVSLIVAEIDMLLSLFLLPNAHPKNLISVLDLCTVIAHHNTQFCQNFGTKVLPLVKDLLTVYISHTNNSPSNNESYNNYNGNNLLFIICLTIHEFCNHSVENRKTALLLSLAPMLLDVAEEIKETNILYCVFLALCFMLWDDADNYKQDFNRFIRKAVQKMKENEQDTKLQLGLAVILGNYAAHNSTHWQLIKSLDVVPLLARAITSFAENPEYYEDLFAILEL